jgi:predicted TIM-barrel fold metal-dependent hydrolase
MKSIDMNAYTGQWPYWPLRNHQPSDLLRQMDQLEIETAVISSLKAVFVDCDGGNAEVAEICNQYPDRFIPAFTYHPYQSTAGQYRENLRSFDRCAVKLFPAGTQHTYEPTQEPFIAELLEYCAENSIPVIIPHRLMISQRLPAYDIQKIIRLALEHPNTTIILASINYACEMQNAMDGLRRASNLLVETSGMMGFRELESFLESFDAERFVHGTAMPLQNPAIGPLRIETAEISLKQKGQILKENAERILVPC